MKTPPEQDAMFSLIVKSCDDYLHWENLYRLEHKQYPAVELCVNKFKEISEFYKNRFIVTFKTEEKE